MTAHSAGGWTRRGTLVALAAVAATPALPAVAVPALPPALAEICIAATATLMPAHLGAAAAEGRSASQVAAALLARLAPGAQSHWRVALIRSGQQDIAAGDTVIVLGRSLMRTEAEVLALGALLRGGPPLRSPATALRSI